MPALVLVLVLVLGSAACGGQGWTDPGPDIDVDPTHQVSGSTFDDRVRACDWLAGRLGGYNRNRSCGAITFTSTPNQSQCTAFLASIPSECVLSYGELAACVNALINGPCTATSFPDACYVLVACPAFAGPSPQP
jgi:hypothetical protein